MGRYLRINCNMYGCTLQFRGCESLHSILKARRLTHAIRRVILGDAFVSVTLVIYINCNSPKFRLIFEYLCLDKALLYMQPQKHLILAESHQSTSAIRLHHTECA